MHAQNASTAFPGEGRSTTRRDGTVTHHPEYPLERACTHLHEPFQLTFAQRAQGLFHELEDVELVASGRGLTIRAETEEAIESALEVLNDFFGPQISVTPPTIRYHKGSMLEQPWMGLRVSCGSDRLDAVKADLFVRGATIVSIEIHSGVSTIQACAPLADLIGYASDLEKIAGGSGQLCMWLSHYSPVEGSPVEEIKHEGILAAPGGSALATALRDQR